MSHSSRCANGNWRCYRLDCPDAKCKGLASKAEYEERLAKYRKVSGAKRAWSPATRV